MLTEIGQWLSLNGEAIYGSRPFTVAAEGPAADRDENYDTEKLKKQLAQGGEAALNKAAFGPDDFRFTTNNGNLYVTAYGWPESGKYLIRSLKKGGSLEHISSVEMLGVDTPLSFSQTAEGLEVSLPGKKPCENAWVLRIPM